MSTSKTWLTQEAYDRLKEELTHISTKGREEIVARIAAAREEGDLKENGGYHAAREEQGKLEARIRQLTAMLESAEVGSAPQGAMEEVTLGSMVTVEMGGEKIEFLLGSREIAAENVKVFSEKSPLGAAVLGKKIGASTDYLLPNGKKNTVKILAVNPYLG
ncbi:MAG: transcription elongation factor GreA [Actinobacteria bacterium]|uniref:Transcription elongation factor GreA n=1 Tax=Candidatus Fonsibacter lacus TaxID=2576439 RepID=A0A965GDC6_9PROT|nr:transcription elongation factor GreA [Candidatus Fonsibacter lacus]